MRFSEGNDTPIGILECLAAYLSSQMKLRLEIKIGGKLKIEHKKKRNFSHFYLQTSTYRCFSNFPAVGISNLSRIERIKGMSFSKEALENLQWFAESGSQILFCLAYGDYSAFSLYNQHRLGRTINSARSSSMDLQERNEFCKGSLRHTPSSFYPALDPYHDIMLCITKK